MLSNHELFTQGTRLELRGDASGALKFFDELLERVPDHYPALYMSGKLHNELGNFERALELLLQAHHLAPTSYDTLIELGNARYDLGHFDEAENAWKLAVSIEPEYGMAYHNLAIIACDRVDYANAIKICSEGMTNVDYPPLYNCRSLCYMELGKFDEAIKDLNHCIEQKPKAAALRWHRAKCYQQKGKLPLALEDAKHAAKLDPHEEQYSALVKALTEQLRMLESN